MADHISALSRSCFFQLRQFRSIKQSLTLVATKTLVHAFVSSRLGCKWSRMLPLVLSPVFGSTSAWRQFYAVYTSYQFDNGSLLKRQLLCSIFSTDKRRCTWPSCADRYHPTLGIVIFVLHSLVGWSFHVRKQATVTAASLFTVPLCGTVCRTTCGYRTCR